MAETVNRTNDEQPGAECLAHDTTGAEAGCGKKVGKEKTLTPEEQARLLLKVEVARELGLWDKVQQVGWGGLTAAESGRVGGVMTRKERAQLTRDNVS